MPLIDIDTNKTITRVPYTREFEAVKRKLDEFDPRAFPRIIEEINRLIDESISKSGKKIATAGWLPGSDWTGTVFDPIYSKGTGRNYDLSARFFGQCVWYAVMKRPEPERWASGRYKVGDRDIGSRTYFRIREE